MPFKLPEYRTPDFSEAALREAPFVQTASVSRPGVAPVRFHATSVYPEYFKLPDIGWHLATHSRMDCAAVVQEESIEIRELRTLRPGERVVIARTDDGSEGVLVHNRGFAVTVESEAKFQFRISRSRETPFSSDYDKLYELLRYERGHGYIVWVLGPAVVFDHDSRRAMEELISAGYADAVLAGNALATHDLEAAIFGTALGQDIYTKIHRPQGHYHHLEVINRAWEAGSIQEFIAQEGIANGVIHACLAREIPFVLAGSIRDDGPLPGVIRDATEAQQAMREHTKKATTVIALATQLHSIAVGNMTPSYQVSDGVVRPVYTYVVDVSEFAANKLGDRGSLGVVGVITNVQDLLVNLERNLVD